MPRGFFLTFEGLDGSGKSTQLRKLHEWLARRGEDVVITRQPGGTRLGDRIRSLLLDSRRNLIDPRAELGLMFSDRAQAIAEVIRPALDRGAIVLCDRYTDSTEAYQGAGRELGSARVLALHHELCGLDPDLTFFCFPTSTPPSPARGNATRLRRPSPVKMRTASNHSIPHSSAASTTNTASSPSANHRASSPSKAMPGSKRYTAVSYP